MALNYEPTAKNQTMRARHLIKKFQSLKSCFPKDIISNLDSTRRQINSSFTQNDNEIFIKHHSTNILQMKKNITKKRKKNTKRRRNSVDNNKHEPKQKKKISKVQNKKIPVQANKSKPSPIVPEVAKNDPILNPNSNKLESDSKIRSLRAKLSHRDKKVQTQDKEIQNKIKKINLLKEKNEQLKNRINDLQKDVENASLLSNASSIIEKILDTQNPQESKVLSNLFSALAPRYINQETNILTIKTGGKPTVWKRQTKSAGNVQKAQLANLRREAIAHCESIGVFDVDFLKLLLKKKGIDVDQANKTNSQQSFKVAFFFFLLYANATLFELFSENNFQARRVLLSIMEEKTILGPFSFLGS
jgi:hypothetical protein